MYFPGELNAKPREYKEVEKRIFLILEKSPNWSFEAGAPVSFSTSVWPDGLCVTSLL